MPAVNPPLEIDVATAAAWRRAGACVLDVREPAEHALVTLPGSRLVPLARLPADCAGLPRDRPLLVLCHHGGRSLRATQLLRAQGWANAVNVAGGIDAWAREVDPALPRY